MTEPDISEVLAGALLENDQLRARVAELEAQVAEIPDLLLIAHMQGAEQAKDQIQALRAQIEALDCRLVGRVAELSGSHCPADKPCDRCVAERRIEELSHAYAVQGLALEDLTAERDRYREALRPFAALDPYKWGSEERVAILAARAALKEPTK